MIDLDARPSLVDGGTARPKLIAWVVAAFVAGVALGGVGLNELRDARDARSRAAAVSLVAFNASATSAGSNAAGVVEIDGQLAVVNAGPAPFTVRAATGRLPAVLVRDAGKSRLVRPGGTAWLDVKVRIDCAIAVGSEPLPMRFTVETADGRSREVTYPVALLGSAWLGMADHPCERFRAER